MTTKFRVEIVQELELPDGCTVEVAAGEQVVKLGSQYLGPSLEYLSARSISGAATHFSELDEKTQDIVAAAVVLERKKISKI